MKKIQIFPSSFSPSEKALVSLQSLYFFTGSLGGIFLNIFIFKIGGFSSTVLFNLTGFSLLVAIYSLSGYLLSKIKTNVLILISFLFFNIAWIMVFILRHKASLYIIPIGLFYGIGQGLFWSSFNLTQYINTHSTGRNRYFGILNTYINFLRAISPLIGGLIIYIGNKYLLVQDSGYLVLFIIVILMNLTNIIFSVRLPSYCGLKFSLKSFVHHRRNPGWIGVLVEQFILGLFDVTFGTVSTILFYLIFKREDYLGYFISTMLCISGLASYLGSKLPLEKMRYFIGGIILSATGICIFAFNQSFFGVGVFGILSAVGASIYSIVLSRHILDGIDGIKGDWNEKYHVFIERDFSLGAARVISYMFLYFIFKNNNSELVALNWVKYLPILVLLLGIAMIFTSKYIWLEKIK